MMKPTVITRQEGAKVAHYYAGGADDYYAKDGTAMEWQGEGAAALGLEGSVDPQRFRQLLNGTIDEQTHLRRAANGDMNKERLAFDLTFSAPKGVSLQALVHGDSRVVEAHNQAVTAAMQEAENFAMSRKTTRGKTSVEHTNNLVVGKFRHETSREQEPELHTHAVVLNMTQRGDGQWRALRNDKLFKSQRHIDNVYKAELAKELEAAGFQLRYNRDGNFDMAHFTEAQTRAFSTRGQQIEAALAEQGLTRETASSAEKNQASMTTRKAKEEIDREQMHKNWQARAGELGINFESRQWAGAGADQVERGKKPRAMESPVTEHADQSLRFAIKSETEREAIVTGPKLIEKTLEHGMGRLGIGDVRGALRRAQQRGHLQTGDRLYTSTSDKSENKVALTRQGWIDRVAESGRSRKDATRIVDAGIDQGRLLPGPARYTTQIARQREQSVLRMEREGRGVSAATVAPAVVAGFLAKRQLSDEQARAVENIATTRNRFIGVQGFAGVGKSHMTIAAKDLLEDNGYRVTSLAPYGNQKKDLEAQGMEARTVQSFLRGRDKKIDANTVVILDEAALVPARQMQEVMQTVEEHGGRAVLLGDTEQTKAIEAGKPFAQLQNAGMETSRLTEIQRQKNPELLQAVQLAAEGKTKESVPHISRVEEVKQPESRYASLVADYTALSAEDRKSTLVVTGTNASRHELNNSIRQGLGLAGQGQHYDLLNRLDTTQAERQHSRYYEAGAVIIPERNYKNGLQRGQQYTVLDTGPGNRLTVQGEDGKTIQFSPKQYRQLSVYQREQTELAAGDRIRITRNDKDNDLANGDRFTVQQVGKRHVLAANDEGREVMLDAGKPMFASLGYVSTIHGSQGLTNDRVYMNIDTQSRTTTKDVYYVGISRARHEAVIYTDNSDKLAKAVNRENLKTAALELKQDEQERRHEKAEYRHDKRAHQREAKQEHREHEQEARHERAQEARQERANERDRQAGI